LRERASSYIAGLKVNKYLLPAFGKTKVINFRTAQLETYIKQRQKEASTATINREISLLRRGFNLGFQADPPMVTRVPHFPRLEEHNVRTGYVKPPQYKKLLIELPDELRLLFVFGYHVGVRKGALLRIRWEQVDLDAGFVYMEKKRSGKHVGRVLPIYSNMARSSRCNRTTANTCSHVDPNPSKTSEAPGKRLASVLA
jgi:integrase